MNEKYEKYYIEITYNEKPILRTFLFNTEAEAIKWWREVGAVNDYTKAYLIKEILNRNNYRTISEVIRELNVD